MLLSAGCQGCGRHYAVGAFASLYQEFCLECERTEQKICRICQEMKPLVAFPLCYDMAGGRENKCKRCKADGKRVKKCCENCRIEMPGATGNTRYCGDPCKKEAGLNTPKRERRYQRGISDESIMRRILAMPWGKR